MLDFFESLGRQADEEWLKQEQDERKFPEIAVALFEQNPPSDQIDVTDLLDEVFQPLQKYQPAMDRFGQPPVNLYNGARIRIDALFWVDGTTSIHEHSFSGAFHVLAGSSVHSRYKFLESKRHNTAFRTGELTREDSEILHSGETRPILAGKDYIHQLFHLDAPSVTIVIRTKTDGDRFPQLSYRDPGIAIHLNRVDHSLKRRMKLLDVMQKTGIGDIEEYTNRMVDEGDPIATFKTVEWLYLKNVEKKTRKAVCEKAKSRHGDLISMFETAACESQRRRRIIRFRSQIRDRGPRLLLALLLLKYPREDVERFVAQEFPDEDPIQLISSWSEELRSLKTIPSQLEKELTAHLNLKNDS